MGDEHRELTTAGTVAVGLLDALPDATAVLDHDGVIVAVNRAWRMFALDNGGTPEHTGVGVNYLDVCARSAAAGCSDAHEVAAGLRAVLAGETVESDFEYPCPSPVVGRWFAMRMTPMPTPTLCAVISHSNITRRKSAEEDLERRASQDSLTGLGNRALFVQELERAMGEPRTRTPGAGVGLLFLDLDGFKPVNDTFGHAAGDEVLQTVADRLRRVTRPQDTVARLGGDEFVLVVPGISPGDLAGLVERTVQTLNEPHRVHGTTVTVGASVGSYLATPGEDPAECLERADQSMYAIKRRREDFNRKGRDTAPS